MPVPAIHRTPFWQLDLEHVGELVRSASAVAGNPLRNLFHYVFPLANTFSGNYIELREQDPAQEPMMPAPTKALIQAEIEELAQNAKITRKISICTALNHTFSSEGGLLSFTRPTVYIPHHRLFRVGKSPFGQETPLDNLQNDVWNFSDDETRFLIVREIVHLRKNDIPLKVAMKIAFLAAIFIFYTTPMGWIGGALLLAASLALHIASERFFQSAMDRSATEVLQQKWNDPHRAKQAALNTLNKLKQQNLIKRDQSPLSRLYIGKSGNNFLDFNHPLLSSRINKVKQLII